MAGDEESQNRLNVIWDMQVPEENIFLDYPIKEKRSRIQYNKLIKLLKEDDLLYVSSFTALGDGYKEVEEQWRFLTKTKKVDIVLIEMPDIDTRKGKSGYDLYDLLVRNNIIPRKYFYPLTSDQKCFDKKDYKYTDLPIARKLSNRVLSLPFYVDLDSQIQDEIVKIIER